ncbi:MAG: 1,2-phenylacetyl-CoA epoxidase subunit B [Gammaproteobacteria bacterium]|nr:1,2-phenylacetyl-CoA epoxidase subunit B [Gammaproteobacteria bacterium]MDD9822260.1 1,2-phenylacetyl-CoA epoxidase subunit B [Gammaproteobacteria bacterium]
MSAFRLYEVFVRAHHAAGHQHVGSVRAAGDEEALLHARDLYTRRGEGESLWVVRADAVVASEPGARAALFAPAASKTYRHPTAFPLHRGVKNM